MPGALQLARALPRGRGRGQIEVHPALGGGVECLDHAATPSMRAHALSYISRAFSLKWSTDSIGDGVKYVRILHNRAYSRDHWPP